MKTKAELEQDIINITMKIELEFPELLKYIKEMPVKDSGADTVNITVQNLEEYYNSLEEILIEYAKTHKIMKDKNENKETDFSGYPKYPAADDIYNQGKVET